MNRLRDDDKIGHSGEDLATLGRIPTGVDAAGKPPPPAPVGERNDRFALLGSTSEVRLSTEIWFVGGVYVK
jgi:hypothetical protein